MSNEIAVAALDGMARRWFDGDVVYQSAPHTFNDLVMLTAGVPSYSGVTVNEKTARGFIPFWACVRILGESIATLPMIVYRRSDDEDRERATSNQAYYVLHDEANPHTTAVSFFEYIQSSAVVWGNGYAKIQWDGAGRVQALWQLNPAVTGPRLSDSGHLYYLTTEASGAQVLLDAADVIHIHGMGDDGIQGYRIVELIKNAIGLGLSAEEFGARMFGQGVMPGMALTHPATLSEAAVAHLRDTVNQRHAGGANAWKPLILEEGMTAANLGIPPEDAQFLETRKFQAEEMARWFRIPPHMLGIVGAAQASNVAQQAAEFSKYTLAIWRRKWEQELTRKLFGKRSEFYCEFLLDELLKADSEARWRAYREAWQTGAMSINEIRARENLNPVEGGESYFVPANMIPLDKAFKEPEPVPAALASASASAVGGQPSVQPDDVMQDQDGLRAHVALIHDVLARMLPREADRLARGKDSPEAIRAKWMEETRAALSGVFLATASFLHKKIDLDAMFRSYDAIHDAGGGADTETEKLAKAILES